MLLASTFCFVPSPSRMVLSNEVVPVQCFSIEHTWSMSGSGQCELLATLSCNDSRNCRSFTRVPEGSSRCLAALRSGWPKCSWCVAGDFCRRFFFLTLPFFPTASRGICLAPVAAKTAVPDLIDTMILRNIRKRMQQVFCCLYFVVYPSFTFLAHSADSHATPSTLATGSTRMSEAFWPPGCPGSVYLSDMRFVKQFHNSPFAIHIL